MVLHGFIMQLAQLRSTDYVAACIGAVLKPSVCNPRFFIWKPTQQKWKNNRDAKQGFCV